MRILSIDPGHTGGLALFDLDDESNSLTLIQTLDTPYDKYNGCYEYCYIYNWLSTAKPDLVIMETTLAIASSGTSNAKEVGIGQGMWLTLFALLDLEFEYSYPAVWTKQLGLKKNDKTLTAKSNKKSHIDLAIELYPDFKSNFIGPRGGLKDGVADAVLIGEAWYRKYVKEVINV